MTLMALFPFIIETRHAPWFVFAALIAAVIWMEKRYPQQIKAFGIGVVLAAVILCVSLLVWLKSLNLPFD